MLLLIPLLMVAEFTEARIARRQAPLDELIHSALQMVKPIFGSARQLATSAKSRQESPEKPNSSAHSRLSSARLRELDILGIGPRPEEAMMANADEVEAPAICQGNSRICKFIACTAHNFKHDQSFANLQLAAQLLGDKKLRRTVGANSGAIGDVCREHGMSGAQCSLFSRAFQIVDRFMTTIEDDEEETERPENSAQSRERETPRPIVPVNQRKMSTLDPFEAQNDDPEGTMPRPVATTPAVPSGGGMGSRTWSTLHNNNHRLVPPQQQALSMQEDHYRHHRPVQIFRPPQAPDEPPRANLLDSRRTLISYGNPTADDQQNGTVILIDSGGSVPTARRAPEHLARPPKQRHEYSSSGSRFRHAGMQPLQVSLISLIPYATTTPVPTTTTTTTVSSIPEAAEFAEEDQDTVGNNNEVHRWRRSSRDTGSDYYDELSSSSADDSSSSNSGNGTKNNGITEEQQQLENCLQYLG